MQGVFKVIFCVFYSRLCNNFSQFLSKGVYNVRRGAVWPIPRVPHKAGLERKANTPGTNQVYLSSNLLKTLPWVYNARFPKPNVNRINMQKCTCSSHYVLSCTPDTRREGKRITARVEYPGAYVGEENESGTFHVRRANITTHWKQRKLSCCNPLRYL